LVYFDVGYFGHFRGSVGWFAVELLHPWLSKLSLFAPPFTHLHPSSPFSSLSGFQGKLHLRWGWPVSKKRDCRQQGPKPSALQWGLGGQADNQAGQASIKDIDTDN
jgi:hypothetical protein